MMLVFTSQPYSATGLRTPPEGAMSVLSREGSELETRISVVVMALTSVCLHKVFSTMMTATMDSDLWTWKRLSR